MNTKEYIYEDLVPDKETTKFKVKFDEIVEFDKIDSSIYLVNKPILRKTIYGYEGTEFIIILKEKYKILFVDKEIDNRAERMYHDYLEDIGFLTMKYEYIKILGRLGEWGEELTDYIKLSDFLNNSFDKEKYRVSYQNERKVKLLISLIIGSINDMSRLTDFEPNPQDLLEKVKQKVILYDSNQTRFIYKEPMKKRIVIQGMAGTGKTELLLHKLKDLYINEKDSKIVMTCFNIVLEQELKRRVPDFFDFMKIEEQIKWNERLWIMRSWGTEGNKNSGIYSYICSHYNLKFKSFSINGPSFSALCSALYAQLEQIENFEPCFDYILIDESQDFSEPFYKLCEKVARKRIYIAGDIFQDIFDRSKEVELKPDFLLNKCYRTDPRTLMFAHGVGMGLFEENKINWLEDEEWETIGYNLKKDGKLYTLTRNPINRFGDDKIDEYESIKLIGSERNDYLGNVMNIIDSIVDQYQNVEPDDIGIVFMGDTSKSYQMADLLEHKIYEKYRWKVTKGYKTKNKYKNRLFISNKNNVKGLEFPFIICVIDSILDNNIYVRNSIYMALTRSFITSYLILPERDEKLEVFNDAIDSINKNKALLITEPSSEEKERVKKLIIEKTNIKSQEDIINECVEKINNLDERNKEKLRRYCIKNLKQDVVESDKIETFVNISFDLLIQGII